MILFGEDTTSSYEKSKSLEWIITNGLGGYASSTIIGANTRAYHGLLVASLKPPLKRMLLLSKLEEEVEFDDAKFSLSVNKYRDVIHPQGHRYLSEFSFEAFPTFTYAFEDVIITKMVFVRKNENTTIVKYVVKKSPRELFLSVYPLVNCREFGSRTHRNSSWSFAQTIESNATEIEPYQGAPHIFLSSDKATYTSTGYWYRNFAYDIEKERGYPNEEDAFNPGVFKAKLKEGQHLIVVASDRDQRTLRTKNLETDELRRRHELLSGLQVENEFLGHLVEAADQFTVLRPPGKSVIAGYHWFGDWGRDALISLPGLTLVTKRFHDAKMILSTFLQYVDHGLVPAFFAEEGPIYASADTSLWLFYAIHKYLEYTQDYAFVKENFDKLEEVVEAHINGTATGIRMTDDALIDARSNQIPLTWMDVVVEGNPVTPRHGKVVEINALWYNALRVMEGLAERFGINEKRCSYGETAEKAKASFNVKFWNEPNESLFDCLDERQCDPSIRPNQIFSVSLPFEVLLRERWEKMVLVVRHHLLTPCGLRTLSPSDGKYIGRYSGDQRTRDEAYHQGTVWPWLMGPFITAFMKSHDWTSQAKEEAKSFLQFFSEHLTKAGLGTISEVFDGDAPHNPGGCIAQAWSVAEVLRGYNEDISNTAYRVAKKSGLRF